VRDEPSATMPSPQTVAPRKSPWRRVFIGVQIVLIGVALVYAAIRVQQQWGSLRNAASDLTPHWLLLACAALIVFTTWAVLVQSWRTLVFGFGGRLRYLTAVRIWTVSNLGRYIPGSLWSLVGMGIMAEQEGIQPATAAGSALIGTVINIGVGFGVIALSGSRVLSGVSPAFRLSSQVCAALFVLAIIAAPKILPVVTKWIPRSLSRVIPTAPLPASTLWKVVTLNVLSWFGYGWAFMVFSQAIFPNVRGSFSEFVAIWAAGYVAGFVAFLLPAGLGVREGVFIGLMFSLGITGKSEAALISIASRLFMTILDIVPGLIGLAVSPLARSKSRRVD
jgi:hypothetical protein